VMVRSASRHAAAEAPFFISFSVASSPSSLAPHGARSKEWPWCPGKDVGRRRRWLLAGARVHPRVSAPPSSGSVVEPMALSLTSAVHRRSGEGPASWQLALPVRMTCIKTTPQRQRWWRQDKALVGPSPSRPFDLGLG
jgi:hypothetical protein